MKHRTTPLTGRPKRRDTSPRHVKAAGLATALALLGAACGSSTDNTTTINEDAAAPPTTEAVLQDSGLPSLGDENQNPAADDSDSSVDDPPLDETEAVEAFIACMQENGIDTEAIEQAPLADQQALTSTSDFLEASAECEPILEDAFGDFELDPEVEAALADRSAEMAACGREVLGVEIPDDVLLLDDDDPRVLELEALETTPEQDAALEACAEEILGDLVDDDGNLVAPEGSDS